MLHQVDDALPHAMSGIELSRVRTELRLLLREHINQRLLASRAPDIVMQSSGGLTVTALGKAPQQLLGRPRTIFCRQVFPGAEPLALTGFCRTSWRRCPRAKRFSRLLE